MGTHGKIIVTSTKDVSIGNIYAGNLSTTGEAAPSTIPATIDIDVTTNSKIGLSHTHPTNNITVESGIYGTGAITNATFVFKGHTYAILGTTELRNFEMIHIENGQFGPKSTSDLSNIKVKVSQTGKINCTPCQGHFFI